MASDPDPEDGARETGGELGRQCVVVVGK
jgi:hypothetical protein